LKLSINKKYYIYFEKNILILSSFENDVIFDEKPYEMGIIQI
jgi:hypothetical protein